MAEEQVQQVKFIDAHVHGFPDKLFDAIWSHFIKNYWNIHIRMYSDEIVRFIENQGGLYLTLLNYAHKPGISRDLNDWSYKFGKSRENVLSFGTIHPDDPYLDEELERVLSPDGLDLKGLKLQILVTDFDPTTKRLDSMYESLIKHGKILVMHVGTGPIANEHVGIDKLRPVLDSYPELNLQIPHLGCFEYDDFLPLALDYPSIYFDTAMVLIDHDLFPVKGAEQDPGIDQLLEIQDHVMFGSDFPNIPYDFSIGIESILQLPVDEPVKEKILFKNALSFYNIE
ncbi:MAG: amidohydrolase family protein [Candidatus Hodarchaeota archaeon]